MAAPATFSASSASTSMSRPDSPEPARPSAPSEAALAAFCDYLRLLELGQDADWQRFCSDRPGLEAELTGLLEEYERVTAILERLTPEGSFSERLRARYGDSVDPGISLSGEFRRQDPAPSASGASGPASDVLGRLSPSGGEGRRYEPRREIARGGMGAILEVWDGELRRTLAMKMVLPAARAAAGESSEGQTERRLSRFLEEAQITGQLDHPGIVPVHDIGIDEEGNVFFTMQLVDGLDLRKVFELARLERDGWTQRRVVGVLIRVCEAMAYAHSKGVIHRDLKPANIMVGRFGEAFVMDWGLAKVVGAGPEDPAAVVEKGEETPTQRVRTLRSDENSDSASALQTLDGDIVGTPSYMAPEQARGKLDELGPRCDVYSIGAMLYHLLSGHMPYEPLGERAAAHAILRAVLSGPPWPLQQLNPEVNEELAAICSKAMARRPEDRYGEVMALGEELRAWVEGRGVQAYTGGVLYETRKWMERNFATTVALLVLIFFAMASVLVFIWQQQLSVSRLRDEQEIAQQASREKDDAERVLQQTVSELRANQQQLLAEAGRAQRATSQAKEDERRAREATQRANAAAENARRSELAATQSAYRSHINAAAYSLRLNSVQEARDHLEECPPSRRGWEWQHLRLSTDASLGAPVVQEGGLRGLLRSEDGAVLLSYGLGVPVRAWDSATGRSLGELEVLSGPAPIGFGRTRVQSHAALHPSGELAVVSNPNGFAQLFNVSTGAATVTYAPRTGAAESIVAIAITQDERQVVTASMEGAVRVYSLLTGVEVSWFSTLDAEAGSGASSEQLACLAVDPEAEFVVTGTRGGDASVWELATGERLASFSGIHEDEVSAVTLSSDRTLVATVSRDGSVAVWDRATGELQSMMHGHRGGVSAVIFVADDEELVTGGEDATLRTWRVQTGRQLRVLQGHDAGVTALVAMVDTGRLASASDDGSIRFWDLSWDPALDRFPVRPKGGALHSLSAGADGRSIYLAKVGELREVDLVDGFERPLFVERLWGVDTVLIGFASSPDGELCAISLGNRTLEVRRSGSGELLRSVSTEGWGARELSFSADSRYLAVGGRSKQALVLDLSGGQKDVTIQLSSGRPGFGRSLRGLALSPDGAQLATVDSEGDVRLWDARTGRLQESRRNLHGASVTSIAFSPEGDVIATAGRDHLVKLLRASDLEPLHDLEGHQSGVQSLAFSPEGDRLASASGEGQVLVWDVSAGELLLELSGAEGSLVGMRFMPLGDSLVAAQDSELLVWNTRDGSARHRARQLARSGLALAQERVRALLESTCSPELTRAALLSDASLTRLVRDRALGYLADARSSVSVARQALEPLLVSSDGSSELLQQGESWLRSPWLADEGSSRWQGLQGAACVRLGDADQALLHFDRLAVLGTLGRRDWLFVALAQLDRGEPLLAAEALERARSLASPGNEYLRTLDAEVSARLGEPSDG